MNNLAIQKIIKSANKLRKEVNLVSDELVKLNELYKSGAISEEDYKKAKDKILS